MKKKPSRLRGLQYFETVARHGSVKLAAEELGVTASAVSRQLHELTALLGEQLVSRSGRGIVLTQKGRQLADKLGVAFDALEISVLGVIGKARPQLRLAVCTSFGPGWLVGRLGDFQSNHPDIDIELRLFTRDPVQSDHVADAFVTADPVDPGYAAVRLFDETLVAVRAPKGCCGDETPRLITTELERGREGGDWRDFTAATGGEPGEPKAAYRRATHYLLALEMAKAGLGVALVPDFLAERDLASGALTLAHAARRPSGRTYNLCFKASRASEPAIAALAAWLKAQGAAFVRQMAANPQAA